MAAAKKIRNLVATAPLIIYATHCAIELRPRRLGSGRDPAGTNDKLSVDSPIFADEIVVDTAAEFFGAYPC
jgi:hypothetical protein